MSLPQCLYWHFTFTFSPTLGISLPKTCRFLQALAPELRRWHIRYRDPPISRDDDVGTTRNSFELMALNHDETVATPRPGLRLGSRYRWLLARQEPLDHFPGMVKREPFPALGDPDRLHELALAIHVVTRRLLCAG